LSGGQRTKAKKESSEELSSTIVAQKAASEAQGNAYSFSQKRGGEVETRGSSRERL